MKTNEIKERGHYDSSDQPVLNWEKNLIGKRIRWTDQYGQHEGEIVARVKHYNAANLQAGYDFAAKCTTGEERTIRPHQLRDAEVINA